MSSFLHRAALAVLLLSGAQAVEADQSSAATDATWRFAVMPDLHIAEKFLHRRWREGEMASETDRAAHAARLRALFGAVHAQMGGDLVFAPGDVANGEWHHDGFAALFMPEADRATRLRAAADIVYGGLRAAMADAGYDRVLVAVGDHELGDDPWRPRSHKSEMIPVFRDAFADNFIAPVQAVYGPDGAFFAPSEGQARRTAYAVRHRDALFVSLDQFRHEPSGLLDRVRTAVRKRVDTYLLDVQRDHPTVVRGALDAAQLAWLDNLLADARRDPGIRHIFVQGHLPVLGPVRAIGSSAMVLEQGVDSPLWSVLRRHAVDVYFAGEVHADTVIQDPDSSVMQVTVRAGRNSHMAMSVDVAQDRYVFRQHGFDPKAGQLVETGVLTIDRGVGVREGTGALRLVRSDAPSHRYRFNDIRDGVVANLGEFGATADLVCDNCIATPQQNDAVFTAAGGMAVRGGYLAPAFRRGAATTIAVTLRADAVDGRRILYSGMRRGFQEGLAILLQGEQVCAFAAGSTLCADAGITDHAQDWRRIAVRHRQGGMLSELELWMDGVQLPATLITGPDRPVSARVSLSLAGHAADPEAAAARGLLPFRGALDEVVIWGRALSDAEMREATTPRDARQAAADRQRVAPMD